MTALLEATSTRTEVSADDVHAHAAAVRAVCRRRLRSSHDVDDAVQETMLRALRSLEHLRDPTRLEPWLCRIAERVCIDTHRDRRPLDPIEPDALEIPDHTSPDEGLLRREEAALVRSELGGLSERNARALWLRDALGEPVQAVAAELGVTEGSARVLLARARKRLREAWSQSAALIPWLRVVEDKIGRQGWFASVAQVVVPVVAVGVLGGALPFVAAGSGAEAERHTAPAVTRPTSDVDPAAAQVPAPATSLAPASADAAAPPRAVQPGIAAPGGGAAPVVDGVDPSADVGPVTVAPADRPPDAEPAADPVTVGLPDGSEITFEAFAGEAGEFVEDAIGG